MVPSQIHFHCAKTQTSKYSGFVFLGLHSWDMEVSRLGVELELQLLAYTIATAIPDLSGICDLHHSSWQCQILNPLSKARDGTHNLMVPSQIHFHCAMLGTLKSTFKINTLI